MGHNIFTYTKNNPAIAKDPSGVRSVYTMGEESDAMREASYDRMNGASADEIRYKYESKGSALSSTISSFVSGAIDNITGAISGKIFKDTSKKVLRGVFGVASEITQYSTNYLGAFAKKASGYIGTTIFFFDSANKTLDKYGTSWRGWGRVGFDLAGVVAAGVISAHLIPVGAAVGATLGVGAMIGFGTELIIRGIKAAVFRDNFWS